MRRRLQTIAAVLAVAGGIFWLAAGANRGWTKTQVPVKTVDEVTGIEAIGYQKRFVPGVDLLALALAGAIGLAGASFFFHNKPDQIEQHS